MWSNDRPGQERAGATLVGIGVVLVVVAAAVVVADVGIVLRSRLQAAAAADAAALAAAPLTFTASAAPSAVAARFAEDNGATLLRCVCAVDQSWRARTVTVVVASAAVTILVGEVDLVVSSRAEFVPTDLFAPAS